MVKQKQRENNTSSGSRSRSRMMKKNTTTMDGLGEDLLNNILQRLPAKSCASAACVSRSWNLISSRILSSPKLSSAFSLNPSLQGAVDEVFDKVLSEPIRPQFAIASIGPSFNLKEAHQLITERLGSGIPVITSVPHGIIGRNALTDEFKEIQWEVTEHGDVGDTSTALPPGNRGILLTVGHLPGLKATLISLRLNSAYQELFIDEFVMDINGWTSSISDSLSPAGVILFADWAIDMKPVLEKMDYAFPAGTAIVGDGGGQFLYRGEWKKTSAGLPNSHSAAVALVFARDRERPHGAGETGFHVMLSAGISPIGPMYKAVSVKERKSEWSTWLTARRESFHENLDGQTILDHIYDEIGDRIQYPAFYIGVTKRRKCSVGKGKVRWLTFHEFHEVMGGDEEYLFVNDIGIKTGDSFHFYVSNSTAALSSCESVSDNFRHLRQYCDHRQDHNAATSGSNKKLVFGGMIFSCCGRGESFFGQPNVDSLPFLENFPGATLAGTFCAGEIGRGDMRFYGQESQEESCTCCFLHVYSSVYLVMSYNPPLT